jgi:hypothetical protein
MVLDEDPSHTAKGSVGLAEELEIELLWLPKRATELNPVEGLWGDGKDVVRADHQYESIDEQAERFVSICPGSRNETRCRRPASSRRPSGSRGPCQKRCDGLIRGPRGGGPGPERPAGRR